MATRIEDLLYQTRALAGDKKIHSCSALTMVLLKAEEEKPQILRVSKIGHRPARLEINSQEVQPKTSEKRGETQDVDSEDVHPALMLGALLFGEKPETSVHTYELPPSCDVVMQYANITFKFTYSE